MYKNRVENDIDNFFFSNSLRSFYLTNKEIQKKTEQEKFKKNVLIKY